MRPRVRAATRLLFLPYAIGSRVRRAIPARRTWLYIRSVGGRGGRVGVVGGVFREGRAVPVGRILRAPLAFGVSGLLLASRRQGILRPTFATPTSDDGYQGGPIYIARRTRLRAAWPLGGRAQRRSALVSWPRNPPLGLLMSLFTRAFARRRSGNYRMSFAVPHSSGRVVVPGPPTHTREGANLQRNPGGCCARFTGYAMADWMGCAYRTVPARRTQRSILLTILPTLL